MPGYAKPKKYFLCSCFAFYLIIYSCSVQKYTKAIPGPNQIREYMDLICIYTVFFACLKAAGF